MTESTFDKVMNALLAIFVAIWIALATLLMAGMIVTAWHTP